jgi:hypothetical protein
MKKILKYASRCGNQNNLDLMDSRLLHRFGEKCYGWLQGPSCDQCQCPRNITGF